MSQADVSQANIVVWFEIPTQDLARATRFYQDVLGVHLRAEQMGSMKMAVFPHSGETVSGALVAGEGLQPNAGGSIVYLNAGEDLAPALARVVSAGGKVLIPKTLISPEIGYFAHLLDSEGNRVGLHSLH